MRPLTPEAAAKAAQEDIARIVTVLSAVSGNVGVAAEKLGIKRRTLDRRITEYGLRDWLSATFSRSARQPKRTAPKSK